jgi:hypothetical protein
MLTIADQEFKVSNAELSAHIALDENGWALSWDFDFRTVKKEVAGGDWQPHLSSHHFSAQLPSLLKLENYTCKLNDFGGDNDEEAGDEPQLMMYVFEHTDVRDVTIKFGLWQHTNIAFELNGNTDIYWDKPTYYEHLQLIVNTDLHFTGVTIDEPNIEKAKEQLGQFFDVSLFSAAHKKNTGMCFFAFLGFNKT